MADEKDKEEKQPAPAPAPAPSETPAWKGSRSSMEPMIGPDGHVILSQADIDAYKDK